MTAVSQSHPHRIAMTWTLVYAYFCNDTLYKLVIPDYDHLRRQVLLWHHVYPWHAMHAHTGVTIARRRDASSPADSPTGLPSCLQMHTLGPTYTVTSGSFWYNATVAKQ